VNITKNITLQGAGIGNTNISITAARGIESPATNTGAFRITGFTFMATANFGNYNEAILYIQNGNGCRVDHNEFQTFSTDASGGGGNAVHVRYDSAGLIDHNRFIAGGGTACSHAMIQFSNSGTSNTTTQAQNYSWLNYNCNALLGSADHTLFVEDNYFYNPRYCSAHNMHSIYGRHGGVIVFRHNETHNMNADNHGFESEHGGYCFEISNNQWIEDVSGANIYVQINIRGGTGVIYRNSRTGTTSGSYGVFLEVHRATTLGQSGTVTSYIDGYGNVRANQGCPTAEGYPCAESIGMGQNNGGVGRVRDPLYIWGNTNFRPFRNESGETWVKSGVDYFLDQGPKPGYVAYPYPHPLTGEPCKENCAGGSPPPVAIPKYPINMQVY